MLLSGGDYGFAFRLGSTYPDSGGAVATDSAGNVYVVGLAGGTINYNPQGSVKLSGDAFIAKYTASGSFVWAHTITGDIQYEGADICVGPDEDFIYVTGGFAGTVNFNLGSGPDAKLHSDKAGAFVLKVTSGGSLEWARAFAGTVEYGTDGTGIAVDAAGNVYTAGFFSDTVDFDPADGSSHVYNMTSPRFGTKASKDVYVSKLDSGGNFVWAKQVSGNFDTGSQWDDGDQGFDIALDSQANVYTTGTFRGKDVDFDPNPNSQYLLTSSGPWDGSAYYNDAFVWKLDTNGNCKWATRLGGPAQGRSIAVDASGNAYAAGMLNGEGEYFRVGNNNGGYAVHPIQSATGGTYGATTVFVSEFNPDGSLAWASGIGSFPNNDNQTYNDPHVLLGLDGRKSVYVAGQFRGSNVDFDPDLAKTCYLSSAGGTDIFVTRLDDQAGGLVSVDRIGGTSDDLALGLAIGPGSSVYTTGSFEGTVDFDPSGTTHNLTSAGQTDAFVWKLEYTYVSPLTLSASSASPFGELTVTSDVPLDTSSPLTARFSNDSGYTVDVPVESSTADTATLVVPAYVDPTTGQFGAGTVRVELVQNGRVVAAAAAPLQILDLVESIQTPGRIVFPYLNAAAEELRAVQDALPGTVIDTSENYAGLAALADRLEWLAAQLQTVMNTPSQSVSLGTIDSHDVVLDTAALAQMDRLLLAFYFGEGALGEGSTSLGTTMLAAMSEDELELRTNYAQALGLFYFYQYLETTQLGEEERQANEDYQSAARMAEFTQQLRQQYDYTSTYETICGRALLGLGGLFVGGAIVASAPVDALILGVTGTYVLATGTMLAVDGQSPETVDQFLDSVSRSMDSVAEGLNSLMNKAEGAIKEFGDAADEAIAALKATPSQIPQVVHVESRSSNPQTYEEAGKPLARFDVWLTRPPSDTVTITTSVPDDTEGTITSGSVLTFTPTNWWQAQHVFIAGVDDDSADGDKTYDLVATVLGGTSGYPNQVIRRQIVNVDNEAELTISIYGTSVTEGAAGTKTSATLPVTLSVKSEEAITFKYQTVQASAKENIDYKKVPWTTKSIPAGTTSTTVSVTVIGNDSQDAVDPRSFYVSILPVSDITAEHPQAEVQIDDDDYADVTVEVLDDQTSWKGDTGSFRVKLNSKPTAPVQITVAVDDTTEGKVLSSKLTFTSGNWNKWKTVKVKGRPDGIDDGTVEFHVITSNTTSRDPSYNDLYVEDVTMWNECNDAKPGVTVEVLDSQTSWEGDTGSFRVMLNKVPAADVWIHLSSTNTNEGTVEPADLLFTTDDWNAWHTVTVTGQPNGKLDGTVKYKIVTSATSSEDRKYNRLSVADVNMVNVCGPRPADVTLEVLDAETSSKGDTGKFRVRLNSKPTASVTIILTPAPATEGKIVSANPVFTTSNWSTWKTITVKGLSGGEQDGLLHPYTIITSGAISKDPNYSGMDVDDVQMVNLRNSTPQPGVWTVWIDDQSECFNVIDDENPHQINTGAGKKIGTYSDDHFVSLFLVDSYTGLWSVDPGWWKYTYAGKEYKVYDNMLELSGAVFKNGLTVSIYDSEPLRAAGGAAAGASRLETLSAEALRPLWQEALGLWTTSGLDNASLARLAQTQVQVTDLPGDLLALATPGVIYVDRNAAGYGWFIDPTPQSSEEFVQTFATSLRAPDASPAAGRMDLLTTLSHEIGHVLGRRDVDASQSPDNLMAGILGVGQRRLLGPSAVDAALANVF